jgi:hypothetical protein
LKNKIADILSRFKISSRTKNVAFCGLQLGLLMGCASIKKATVVSGAALGAGAIAGIATSGTAPVLLAATGSAFVTSVGADLLMDTQTRGIDGMNSCAPDNFWSLLGQLVETGGWLLLLIVVVPMLFSWLIPGPVKFKSKGG